MSKFKEFIKNVQQVLGTNASLSKTVMEKTTKKAQVINAILNRGIEVQVDDLPSVMAEMKLYFEENKNNDYFADFHSKDYYRLLDIRGNENARVVVVGDIHCDYYALAAMLLKLSVSDYDYFGNAYFVFLGDYLDRGSALFEPLLLLMDLKRILGDRLIMLRGNHELISYNEEKQELESRVIPQQTCPCLNEYCGEDKAFLESFGYFYKTLPTYVFLKVANQNVLLTHAAVPRMKYFDFFHFNQMTGAIEFDTAFNLDQLRIAKEKTTDDSMTSMHLKLNSNLLNYRNQILYDMIWGDPSYDKEKYQVSGRYEFGSDQFDPYAKKNNISRVFRSHEPVSNGFAAFFENRLYTLFSTGGDMNDQAGYAELHPAFAVVKSDGSYMIENSFEYRVLTSQFVTTINNLFSEEFLGVKQQKQLSLNEEFMCSEYAALHVESVFEKVKIGFLPQEVKEEPVESEESIVAAKEETTPEEPQEEENDKTEE